MAGQGRTIYIAGAGIAGLTLALALAKFGATVVVLEKRRRIDEFGAGLQISPNARRVLDRLGLDRALSSVGFEPEGIDIYPHGATRPLTTLRLGQAARDRFGVPYAVFHRRDLIEVLHKACKRFANIDIVFGVNRFDVATHARGMTVLVDESGGRAREARPFALVGADGVRSTTRTGLLGGPDSVYSGYVGWRALLPLTALEGIAATDRTSLMYGPGFHAVIYPLPRHGNANVALFTREPEARAFAEPAPHMPSFRKRLVLSQRLQALMAAIGDTWTHWPLSFVAARQWHAGPIGLIGDAAHAMLPFQAQGAAMAIEDAAILAPLLITEPDAETAFRRYEGLRQARTRRVARVSAANGRAFHLEWPLSLGRDAVIAMQGPLGHFRRLAWLYDYDAAPEIERYSARKTG